MKYGPNTPAVEALIERAGQMTAAEAESLDISWSDLRASARYAALDAVWDAAWSAAWDAVWDAVWAAARDAAWGVAWGAVRDAVLGEFSRDLITVEHYETLMGPWKSVVEGEQS
jgi:hypothetical protein